MKLFKNIFKNSGTPLLLIFSFLLITFIFYFGCSKTIVKSDRELRKAGDADIVHLIKVIEKININSAQSFIANFNIEGHLGKQNYKASGNAQFNNNPRRMRVIFHDAVFKSAITFIVQEEDTIKIFFPFDKILYIDNIKKFNFKFYSNLNLDFQLVSELSTGKIPVIKNYSSIKCYEDGNSGQNNKLIILENNEFYETISFMDDVPDKILWLNKITKEKTEVYLFNPVIKENILFFNLIKIVSVSSDLKLTIQFDSLKFNVPVDLKNMVRLKLPSDIKINKINNGN